MRLIKDIFTSDSSPNTAQRGFTLIELSIVLVVIGLIVGGVLVGRDLIKAAEVRAQVTQMEKLQTAVNVFRGKFNALPGDATQAVATQFGFTAATTREGDGGRGDGNGGLQGSVSYSTNNPVCWGFSGELAWFWVDLSANSKLIDEYFNTATNATITIVSSTGMSAYVPSAKIGNGNNVSVFSVMGTNYFQIVTLTSVSSNSAINGKVGITVGQAYAIDKKIDDGIPMAGNVTAQGALSSFTGANGSGSTITNGGVWAVGGFSDPSYMSSATASSTTCYDTTSNQYSIAQNSGNGVNCALSFKFQ